MVYQQKYQLIKTPSDLELDQAEQLPITEGEGRLARSFKNRDANSLSTARFGPQYLHAYSFNAFKKSHL